MLKYFWGKADMSSRFRGKLPFPCSNIVPRHDSVTSLAASAPLTTFHSVVHALLTVEYETQLRTYILYTNLVTTARSPWAKPQYEVWDEVLQKLKHFNI